MKKLLFALLLMLGAPAVWAQNSGGINGIPNVSVQTPVTIGDCTKWVGDTEVADSGGPCGGTGAPGGSSYSIQYNNAGSFGGFLPAAIGTYCIQWTSLTAAPVPVSCPAGTYPGAGIAVSTGSAWGTSITPGTGVETALGVNIGSAGAFVVNGGALGTPSSGVGTNITGVNAASVGGYTLPCTVPTLVSGDYLTNNGTTCSWAAVSGSGTMTDGTGTTVVGAIPYSSTTAHAYSLLASPTSGAGIYSVQFDPTSTTAVAPTVDQVGVASRSISGATTTDTVLYSDVLGLIVHDKAATGAVNETLPTPATLGNTKFGYTYCNDSAQTDTITPTTYTIAVNGGAAGASITVGTGICAQISVDPFNSTQWDAFTYGASSGGSAAFSAITTGTNTAATMTVGTGATITVTGSGVNNANQVNGAAVATSAAALASNSSGQIIAATTTTYLIDSGTAFTLGTGTGACATDAVVSGSGAATGAVTCSGTTGAATLVVNLPTATIWACTATDITHPATIPESAYTTTSVTFTAASVTSGDTITLSCTGST